jgi:hypothetical protein
MASSAASLRNYASKMNYVKRGSRRGFSHEAMNRQATSLAEPALKNADGVCLAGEEAAFERICAKALGGHGEPSRSHIERAKVGAAESTARRPGARQIDEPLQRAGRREARNRRALDNAAVPYALIRVDAGSVGQSARRTLREYSAIAEQSA